MFKDKKIKFTYISDYQYIDSVYAFDDGDFILFGANQGKKNSKYPSPLYDGKTLQEKSGLNILSECSFSDLKDNKFCIYNDFNSFTLYKFKDSNKTSYDIIQKFNLGELGTIRNVVQISNGDLCLLKIFREHNGLYIFRKIDPDSKTTPYGENFFNHLDKINEIIDLNEKEVLGIQKNFSGIDSLILKVIETNDYKIIRQNEIKTRENNISRFYISSSTTPFQKTRENKLILPISDCIYVFGLDTLELETTISFDDIIRHILIRPKGNIFMLTTGDEVNLGNKILRDCEIYTKDLYLNDIKFDYEKNDVKNIKKENINKYIKKHEHLFCFYNYINNGLITLIDKNEVIIYDDFGDDNE